MKTLVRTLALSLSTLCIAPASRAAAAPLTLTCYNSGAVALTVPIDSLFFDSGLGASSYFTVFTDISRFDDLISQTFFISSFDYCLFSADVRTNPDSVTLESTAASVGMGGTYTQLTFSYSGLTSRGSAKMPTTTKALTAEEKEKALAAFLARVPPPSAAQK